MFGDDVEDLKARHICSACVGEDFLSREIEANGRRRRCDYCGETGRTYTIGDMADRVQLAFEQHYLRTSDQPDDYQNMLLRDRELDYDWDREGEPVVYAIMDAASIPETAARHIQAILAEERGDSESAEMGEETEFADESYYERKSASARSWLEEWDSFETSLKTEARFFSRSASRHLASVFDGIDTMLTHDKRPLVIDAGPDTDFQVVYRARVFQSNDRLEAALCRPDLHLGSPPALVAPAGRMNARGISVFYGANDEKVAIAEVRAPVGSQVAVAKFAIIRKLRLLDLTAVRDATVSGSIFDEGLEGRLERASFLRLLSRRITKPVMPDDEPFEYLPTQAIADFLATESTAPIDGIIYPSVQAAGEVLNVVLFHKSARVETMEIPEGTEIRARTGRDREDGWEPDYAVTEEVPPKPEPPAEREKMAWPPNLAALAVDANRIWQEMDTDWRDASLRVDLASIKVHQVRRVIVETEEFEVRRHRWEKRDPGF